MRMQTLSIFHKPWKPKYYLLCLPILTFLLWTPQTLSADTETLERITEADLTVSYVGVRLNTFISSRGTRTFEELVIHKSPDISYGKELSVVGERKSFGDSRAEDRQEDVRRDGRRRDRDENRRHDREKERGHHKWRQVRSPFSEKEIKLIAQNYKLEKTASGEKIANYETDLLTITPKFAGRPSKRFFFARENGVVLRIEAFDAEGVLRAMSVYTRISFEPEAVAHKWQTFEKEIKPQPQRSYSISMAEAEKTLKTEPIQPGYLPPGFQLQNIHSIKDKEDTIHLIYTDGLLRFSIFETRDKRAHRGNRRTEEAKMIDGTRVHKRRRGPTQSFSWSSADLHFFLFGAMPASEMEKVVKSMIHKVKEK